MNELLLVMAQPKRFHSAGGPSKFSAAVPNRPCQNVCTESHPSQNRTTALLYSQACTASSHHQTKTAATPVCSHRRLTVQTLLQAALSNPSVISQDLPVSNIPDDNILDLLCLPLLGGDLCKVHHTLTVSPLVVVPCDHLDHVVTHDHGQTGVNGAAHISAPGDTHSSTAGWFSGLKYSAAPT